MKKYTKIVMLVAFGALFVSIEGQAKYEDTLKNRITKNNLPELYQLFVNNYPEDYNNEAAFAQYVKFYCQKRHELPSLSARDLQQNYDDQDQNNKNVEHRNNLWKSEKPNLLQGIWWLIRTKEEGEVRRTNAMNELWQQRQLAKQQQKPRS